MNLAETHALLTLISGAFDNRRFDDATVIAWQPIFADLPFDDCRAAVSRHFAESNDYLMPAHIRRLAKNIRAQRRTQHHEIRALPSRFESDIERAVRVDRGLAQCRDVLAPIMEHLRQRRESA